MRLMVEWERAEFRMEVVPFMAGRMMSVSGSSVCALSVPLHCDLGYVDSDGPCLDIHTAAGKGLAMCNTPTTSFSASSKALFTVISGTTAKSTTPFST